MTPVVETVIEIDRMAQLQALPAATVEAAEQLLVAPAPEPELPPALQPEPEPVAEDLPALELAPAIIEPAETEAAEPPVRESVAGPASDRSWSFEAHHSESLPLDQLLQRVVGDAADTAALTEPAFAEPEVAEAAPASAAAPTEPAPIELAPTEPTAIEAGAEPDVVEPIALGSEPESLENPQFAALLAPPPTRIADAIRMPEEPVPTIDMVECHDLDALADDFVASGLTADLPDRRAVVDEHAGELVIAPVVEPVIDVAVEPDRSSRLPSSPSSSWPSSQQSKWLPLKPQPLRRGSRKRKPSPCRLGGGRGRRRAGGGHDGRRGVSGRGAGRGRRHRATDTHLVLARRKGSAPGRPLLEKIRRRRSCTLGGLHSRGRGAGRSRSAGHSRGAGRGRGASRCRGG